MPYTIVHKLGLVAGGFLKVWCGSISLAARDSCDSYSYIVQSEVTLNALGKIDHS